MQTTALEEAVARATGESLREIRRRGFGPLKPAGITEPEPCDNLPNIVNWDELDAQRVVLFP